MRPTVTDRVGRSVTAVSHAKTSEPIEMPFGLRTRVSVRNHVLDGGVQIPTSKHTVLKGMGHPTVKYRDILPLSCAKAAETIEMSFGWFWAATDPRNHVYQHTNNRCIEQTICHLRTARFPTETTAKCHELIATQCQMTVESLSTSAAVWRHCHRFALNHRPNPVILMSLWWAGISRAICEVLSLAGDGRGVTVDLLGQLNGSQPTTFYLDDRSTPLQPENIPTTVALNRLSTNHAACSQQRPSNVI